MIYIYILRPICFLYDERIFLFCVAFNFSFLNIEFSTYSYRLSRTLLRPRRRRRQRDFLFYSFFHRFFFFFFSSLARDLSRDDRSTICDLWRLLFCFFFFSKHCFDSSSSILPMASNVVVIGGVLRI